MKMMRKSNWIVTGTSIAFISICCLGGCRTNPSPSVSSPSPTPKNATNEINSVKTQVTELKSQFKNLDSDSITTDKLPLPLVVNKLKSIQTEYDQFITNHPDSIKQDEDVAKSILVIRQLQANAVKIFDGLSKNPEQITNAQKELKDQLKKYNLAYEINQKGIIDDSTMKAASDYLKKLAPDMEVKLNQLDTLLKQKKIISDMTEKLKNLIEQSYSNQKKENSLYLYLTMFFLLAIILILLWQLNQTKEINKKVDTQTESIIKKLSDIIKIGELNKKNITDIKTEIKEIKISSQEIKSMAMDFTESVKKESSKKLENQKTDPDSLPSVTTDTTHESLLKEGETLSKIESLERQLSEARTYIVGKDEEIRRLKNEISQLKEDLQSYTNNTSLSQQIENLRAEKEVLENARNTLNSELQESYTRNKSETEDLYKQNQESKTLLENKIKILNEKISELQLNTVCKDEEITSLKGKINQLEINKSKPTITPPNAENVEVKIPPEITKLIEDFNQNPVKISSHIEIEVSLDKEMYEKLRKDSSLMPILKNSNNSNENNYLICRLPNKADYYYLIPKLNQFSIYQEHNKAKHLFQYIGYTEEKQRSKFVLDKPGKVIKVGQDWQLIEKGVLNFTSISKN